MSSTSAPASPTDSPMLAPIDFVFNELSNATTCGSLTISWTYKGNISPVILTAYQDDDLVFVGRFQVLSLNWTVSTREFLWQPVNVPAGQYVIQASSVQGGIEFTSFISNNFFVVNGTDTSCIAIVPNITIPISSSTSTPGALSSASTALKVSGGAVAGIVIGVLAFAGGLLAALAVLCARRRRRRRQRRLSRSGFREKSWGVLGSGDAQDGARALRTHDGSFAGSAYPRAAGAGVELGPRALDGPAPAYEPQSARSSADGPPVQPHVLYSPFADPPVLDHKASFDDEPVHLPMPGPVKQ